MRRLLLFVLSLILAAPVFAQNGTVVIGLATAQGSPLLTNSVRTITTSTSVATTDGSVYVDATAGSGITITLPATSVGQAVLLNNLSASSVTIAAGSGVSIGNIATSLGSGQAVIVQYFKANSWSLVTTPATGGTGGGTGAITDHHYVPAAVNNGGSGFSAGLVIPRSDGPQPGVYNPTDDGTGYLAFQEGAVNPQYAQGYAPIPPYWTTTSIVLYFGTPATTGNITFEIQTACIAAGSTPGTPSWGTATTVTVSAPSSGVATATMLSVASNGVNNCPASGTTTPSVLTYRIFRSSSDTAAADAQLIGLDVATARSQAQ